MCMCMCWSLLTLRRVQPQSATIDLARYTKPESIWVALMSGHVRLVRMSWLIEHSKAKGVLARRQELPKEAFISVDELKTLYGDGNTDGVLPIIAISFCWPTPWPVETSRYFSCPSVREPNALRRPSNTAEDRYKAGWFLLARHGARGQSAPPTAAGHPSPRRLPGLSAGGPPTPGRPAAPRRSC